MPAKLLPVGSPCLASREPAAATAAATTTALGEHFCGSLAGLHGDESVFSLYGLCLPNYQQ